MECKAGIERINVNKIILGEQKHITRITRCAFSTLCNSLCFIRQMSLSIFGFFFFCFCFIFFSLFIFSAQIMYFQKCRLHFAFCFVFFFVFLFSVKISYFPINSAIDRERGKLCFWRGMDVGRRLRGHEKNVIFFFGIRPAPRIIPNTNKVHCVYVVSYKKSQYLYSSFVVLLLLVF